MAELGDFLTQGKRTSREITVEMLDYEYVNKCEGPEELRAILEMLRSGKEGIYPHLIEHTEKRLLAVLPEKERKKAMSMRVDPSQGDIAEAMHELGGWVDGMRRTSAGSSRTHTGSNGAAIFEETATTTRAAAPQGSTSRPLPPPRNLKQKGGTGSGSGWKEESNTLTLAKEARTEPSEADKKRISGYDFRSWDLYDVDAECEKLDDVDHRASEAKKSASMAAQRAQTDRLARAHERRSAELQHLRTSMEYEQRSPQEREFLATHEKQKGNECYKAGEAEEAYVHYSRSLALSEPSAVVYANRAMACIKLGRLEQAELDCTRALQIDPQNLKAISRRGMTLHRRGRYREAMADFETALALAPDDKALSELLRQSRAKFHEVSGVKVKIEEIGDGSGVQQIVVRPGVPKALPEGWARAEPQATHFTRIAIGDDDDDDEDDSLDQGPDSDGDALDTAASTSAELKQRGVDCCARGDYVNARIHFAAALDALPARSSVAERTPLLNNLAACSMATHDYVSVIEHTSVVLRDDAQNTKALLRRGAAYEKRGMYEQACADMEMLVANDGSLTDARVALERLRSLAGPAASSPATLDVAPTAESLKNQGNLEMKAGNHAGAVDAYTRALELDGSNLATRNNRALALLKLGQHEDAERDASAVLAIEPNNPKALYRRGAARRERGTSPVIDECSALQLLEQALADFQILRQLEPTNQQASAECAAIEREALRARARLDEIAKTNELQRQLDARVSSSATVSSAAAVGTRIIIEDDDDDDDASSDKIHVRTSGAAREQTESNAPVARIIIEEESDTEEEHGLGASAGAVRISIDEEDDDDDAQEVQQLSRKIESQPPPTRVTIDEDEGEDQSSTQAGISCAAVPPSAEKSDGERSMAAKNEGVAAIQRNDLQGALESFTRAIELDSSNVAASNNRALVHLRLGQYDLAVNDASAVLAADPTNTKALFRRGTARKAMASALVADADPTPVGPLLDAALTDLDAALALEPTNVHAQRERGAVATMRVENEQRAQRAQRARQPEVRRTKVRAKAIPSTPPKTQYELEKVWRDLKTEPAAFAQYIKSFKASTYKKVLKESLNEEVLSGMLAAASEHLSSEAAARMLHGIAQSSGFSMWRMMMTAADKSHIADLAGRIRADGEFSDGLADAFGV